MNLSELKFHKAIYPRGLDKGVFDNEWNEQKADEENVSKIVEVLKNSGEIDHKITYNIKTMHIIDGTHLWIAFTRLHALNWEVPQKYVKPIDIPEHLEMFYAGMYNYRHGKPLTRNEVKAVIKSYMDDGGNIKYGLQKKFSEEYNISIHTINDWVDELRHGVSRHKSDDKTKTSVDIEALKAELAQLKDRLDSICQRHKKEIAGCVDCGR